MLQYPNQLSQNRSLVKVLLKALIWEPSKVILQARYFDGSSLEPIGVQAELEHDRLVIRDMDGAIMSAHPYIEMLLLYADPTGKRVDLGRVGLKDLRLVFDAPNVRQTLRPYLPQVSGAVRGDSWGAGFKVSLGLISAMVFIGIIFWQLENILPAFIPDKTVESFGQELAEDYIDAFGGQCHSPEGEHALQKVVKRLGGEAIGTSGVRVRVVDNGLVNAFALPGGQLVLFDGLLQEAPSAAEVAGVLAHEMGHELHKHSLKGFTRAIGLQLIGTLISGSNIADFSVQMVTLGHSRVMEEEADFAAGKLLAKAEISSEPLADFFARRAGENQIARSSIGNLTSFFSTHPDSRERAKAIRLAATKQGAPVLSAGEWLALQSICGKKSDP